MEIKQVKKVVLIMDEQDAAQLHQVVDKLDAVEESVGGDCQSCPFVKSCKSVMRDDICYIHATKFLLTTMAGGPQTKPDNQSEEGLLS